MSQAGAYAKQDMGGGFLGILALFAAGLMGCSSSSSGDSIQENTSGDLGVEPATAFVAGGPTGGPFNDSGTYTVANSGEGDLFWSATSNASWLSVSQASGTLAPGASQELTVSVNGAFADGLVSGNYQGSIEFSDLASGDEPARVTAFLEVQAPAPEGDLAVAPSTFAVSGPQGGPFVPASQAVTLTNPSAGSATWSAASSVSWLALSQTAGTLAPGTSLQVTISVNTVLAEGLAIGSHFGSIVFLDQASGNTAQVAASLEVQTPAGGGNLVVSPSSFATGGPKGGPFTPLSQAITLTNPASQSVNWSATSDVSWLALSQASGSVAAGGQLQVSVTVQDTANALGTGPQAGKITFRDSNSGNTLAEIEATLGVGTTIENQAWLNVHGKPFIPIGVWNQPPWDTHVTYMKGLGINTYLNNGLGGQDPTNPQLMDLLEANDMWAIMQYDPAIRGESRLLGWLMGDEPDLHNTPVATVQQNYNAIRAADPDHFIALNTTGNFYWDSNYGNPSVESLYQGYFAIPDIASFDFYPVSGWIQPGWVYMPGAMSAFLRERYMGNSKPVWAIIEASDQRLSWLPAGSPGPTAAQMRFEVWNSLINGATAIHYFTIAFDPFEWANLTPTIEQELTRTNGQITALTDVILSAPPAFQLTSSESNGLLHNVMLRQKADVYYVFADNADMAYGSETITFTFPQTISSVSVYGEGRAIAPTGSSFTDSFNALEVHIYEVRL